MDTQFKRVLEPQLYFDCCASDPSDVAGLLRPPLTIICSDEPSIERRQGRLVADVRVQM